MNLDLPELATEFAAAAARAFGDLGGVDCARRAEADPAVRQVEVAKALDGLGAMDVDPRSDVDSAAAAGELCRMAGRNALPYPVASLVMRGREDGLPFAVVGDDRPRVDHGDLFGEWRISTLDGRSKRAGLAAPRLASKLGPFVNDLEPGRELDSSTRFDVSLHLALSGWSVLGSVERALELAVHHVSDRVQFGQRISEFQAVQFQLADAAVAVDGLRELCRFTLWRLFADRDQATADGLALRLFALDSARSVLRTSQQLHGASGLCDEYDISVLCRHVQPQLRIPFGVERTASELFSAVATLGFAGLFPHGGRTP